jgi:hypothetical protein
MSTVKSEQEMNRTKLIATASLVMALMTMIAPDQISTYASPTTEDDGYTYPDDASEKEKEEIDERNRIGSVLPSKQIIVIVKM